MTLNGVVQSFFVRTNIFTDHKTYLGPNDTLELTAKDGKLIVNKG